MFKNKLVKTKNLNQAAFLTTFGSPLKEVVATYPNNVFVIEASPLVLWMEKHFGWIPYRRYTNQRVRLKDRARKQAGLPEHFTGRHEGFNFAEIAQVREFTAKEKKNLEQVVDKSE